jgi:hypothetical protein
MVSSKSRWRSVGVRRRKMRFSFDRMEAGLAFAGGGKNSPYKTLP